MRDVDGRMASYAVTSDSTGDRSVYRIGTLSVIITRDAMSGTQMYAIHDDGGATEDVSFDSQTDTTAMATQSEQLAMSPEVNAILSEPVAVLLSRIMFDTNLAAEVARRRMVMPGVLASAPAGGGFCDGSLPSDVKLALDAKAIVSCGAFVTMTALSVPAIQVTLAVGEVGPLVIFSILDAGLGLHCLRTATNRSTTDVLKLLPCAVAYVAGL